MARKRQPRAGLRRVRVPDTLAALIGGLHPQTKRKLRAAIESVAADPRSGKPLRDELSGLLSLRVGRHRLIYRFERSQTVLVAFGPRERIYEETLRLVRAENPDNS